MNAVLIEFCKVLVMIAAAFVVLLIRRDLVPFIQSKVTAEQFGTAREMAEMFVYMAQQMFKNKPGEERKAIVKGALKSALQGAGIELTDQFIDDMIEAAVKGMKIAESAGKEAAGGGA